MSAEILVHNVSHSDLILSINNAQASLLYGSLLGRPKFSHFKTITHRIKTNIIESFHQRNDIDNSATFSNSSGSGIDDHKEDNAGIDGKQDKEEKIAIDRRPKYERDPETQAMSESTQEELALGFDFRKKPIVIDDIGALKLRKEETDKQFHVNASATASGIGNADIDPSSSANSLQQGCLIEAAFFPLLSILVPKWLTLVASNPHANDRHYDPSRHPLPRLIIILVTGRGTPVNRSHSEIKNSTKHTGELMKLFLNAVYPSIEVVQIHSKSNLFRYDHNIQFVKDELQPKIDEIRNDLAYRYAELWREMLHVTLSFADGSSARVSAINASLRHYRPFYMHFWQLKTFWVEGKLCEDDIEFHEFEEINTETARELPRETENTHLYLITQEMLKFKADFEKIRLGPEAEHDLSAFWLRKTKKPVLSVLLVQKPGNEPKLYRGSNMEVSMPTGSLCAERNVIGSALADDLTLRRQDLKLIAVFSAGALDKPMLGNSASVSHESAGSQRFSLKFPEEIRATSLQIQTPPSSPGQISTNLLAQELKIRVDSTTTNNDFEPGDDLAGQSILEGDDDIRGRRKSDSSLGSGGGNLKSPTHLKHRRRIHRTVSNSSSIPGTPLTSAKDFSSPGASNGGQSNHASDEDDEDEDEFRLPPAAALKPSVGGANEPKPKRSHSDVALSSAGEPVLCRESVPSSTKKVRLLTSVSSPSLSSLANIHSGTVDEIAGEHSLRSSVASSAANATGISTRGSQRIQRLEIVVDAKDMNPLKPCGACHEWLKKIAEVNPQFSVVTFSDYNCQGYYCEQIQD